MPALQSESPAVHPTVSAPIADPLRLAFVMHAMQVAGAEVLVTRIIHQLRGLITPTVVCLDAIGQLGHELQREGVEVLCLNRRSGRDLKLAGRLARALTERRIELVHAHQYTPFFYSALAKLWGKRSFELIFTEHGRHYPDVVSAKRRWINRLVLSRLANSVNACCRFSANALANLDGFTAAKIDVIYNGVDAEEFRPAEDRGAIRRDLGLKPDRKYAAMIARFHPVKDHATLLRGFQHAAAACPNVDLILVGDGPERAKFESLTAELGLVERVQFWGVRSDVARILQAMDVFVLSSISEAASLTLLEAMASGRPVVVGNVGGNPEIVTDGVEGLLFERQQPEQLAAALIKLFTDNNFSQQAGDAGRERVLKDFQWSGTMAKYEALYRQVAARQQGRSA